MVPSIPSRWWWRNIRSLLSAPPGSGSESTMSESIAEVAAAQEALSISKYFDLSSATLYIYDHLISLDSEIELFWRRRAFASALFLLNRYLTLFCMLAQFTIFIIPPPA
ncbi:hypothetical protein BD311DRAFT_748019 [Dichomitus squalens]|uniref:DUF6533 domain-containing protein n=1 Tax=Dichomitus squalens TaxID=114155 RepID=A0A4Q9N1N8_9APHY|nr:hypothetical protein BD311DRAFT_748019 [Dichomitus squalens]